MAGRRFLLTIVLLAAFLHAIAIARSLLPAQDGLKFIRIARQFQINPWPDVVRGSDQHPLYPALIAAVEPVIAIFAGSGPNTWRIAAQTVAAIAALGLLFPLYGITRSLFDERIACIAVAIFALLPIPAEVGHDTLSDSLGLLTILLSLRLGAVSLRTGDWRPALGTGLVAGLGYLARPEVILAPIAIGLAWLLTIARSVRFRDMVGSPAMPTMALAALVLVGSYALIKGELSEKLALRHGASLGSQRVMIRPVPQWLPRGLDDGRWDFSPKEESDRVPIRNVRKAVVRIAAEWWAGLCWGFAAMTVWGLARQRFVLSLCRGRDPADSGQTERRVLAVFAAILLFALVRHSTTLGYLSSRHTLALVLLSVPWAAAGTFVCMRGLGMKLPWSRPLARTAGIVGTTVVAAILVGYQLRPSHPSRWGHWAAGRWLAEHAQPSEVVLDTRGWARFISGGAGYDYWHVRQALTDGNLAYIVVGNDELEAKSPRARTLNALLHYAATPAQDFPAFEDGRKIGVRIYRFHRPASWEGVVQ
jgi:4-amino-4-deoxy-L-arabinose transferase-like glycosyltransferase